MSRDKKFILLSYIFPPAGGSQAAASIRLGKLAYYIKNNGWDPIVITTKINSYPDIDNTIIPTDDIIIHHINDPLPRFRGRHWVSKFLPCPGDLLLWTANVVVRTIALINKHDCKIIFRVYTSNCQFHSSIYSSSNYKEAINTRLSRSMVLNSL